MSSNLYAYKIVGRPKISLGFNKFNFREIFNEGDPIDSSDGIILDYSHIEVLKALRIGLDDENKVEELSMLIESLSIGNTFELREEY